VCKAPESRENIRRNAGMTSPSDRESKRQANEAQHWLFTEMRPPRLVARIAAWALVVVGVVIMLLDFAASLAMNPRPPLLGLESTLGFFLIGAGIIAAARLR
jgi:hypothetical protein